MFAGFSITIARGGARFLSFLTQQNVQVISQEKTEKDFTPLLSPDVGGPPLDEFVVENGWPPSPPSQTEKVSQEKWDYPPPPPPPDSGYIPPESVIVEKGWGRRSSEP